MLKFSLSLPPVRPFPGQQGGPGTQKMKTWLITVDIGLFQPQVASGQSLNPTTFFLQALAPLPQCSWLGETKSP